MPFTRGIRKIWLEGDRGCVCPLLTRVDGTELDFLIAMGMLGSLHNGGRW